MERRVGGETVADAPKPEEEKAALVALCAAVAPDLLGVCEIGGRDDLADLQGRLRAAGVDLPHAEWVGAADLERHLALLSRFPVVASNHQTDLTYDENGGRLPFQRGVLDATVQVNPGYRLRLLGLHLKSKREVPEGDQALMRRHEAHLARQHAERVLEADPSTNLVVYGDFNDTRNEAPVRALQGDFGTEHYLRDIQLADRDGYRWTYYWRYADQYSRFDFVLVSRALYPEVLSDRCSIATSPDWFTASDHRPLVVKVTPADRETP
jgi:endonuclease/exonuclease/phosphatase family metal-dependent hydrolase